MILTEIVGLQECYYIKSVPGNKNTKQKVNGVKHSLFCLCSPNIKFQLDFETFELKSSDKTAIIYPSLTINVIDIFGPITHVIKSSKNNRIELPLKIQNNNATWTTENKLPPSIKTNIFDFFPSVNNLNGYYNIKMSNFNRITRKKAYRSVYIFSSMNDSSKLFLASKSTLNVYDTDSSNKLPLIIYADIVILGNKYKYTIDEVCSSLFKPVRVIFSNFTEYKMLDETA